MAYKTMGYLDTAFQVTATGRVDFDKVIAKQVVIAKLLSANCTSSNTDHPFLTADIDNLLAKGFAAVN